MAYPKKKGHWPSKQPMKKQLTAADVRAMTEAGYPPAILRAVMATPVRSGGFSGPRIEKKYVDATPIGTTVGQAGVLGLCNGLQQGTAFYQRIGRKVSGQYIWLRYNLTMSASASETMVRLILVEDNQTNAVGPTTLAQILQNVDNAGNTSSNIRSFRNLDNRERFRTIYDATHCMSINGVREIYVDKYIRLPKGNVQFNAGSAGTVADIVSGSIHLIAVSDEITNTPTVSASSRFMYTD